ncbi:7034_t:CDS:2, partial [Entrophospora sp. SA101]
PNCGKSFRCKSSLNQHSKIEKDIKCEYPGCNKAFYFNGNLLKHMRYHLGIKNFKCEYPGCAKAFYQNSHLLDHTRRHLGIKNSSVNIQDVQKHFIKIMCKSTPWNKYKYLGCAKTFYQKTELPNNTKCHLGIKNFKCEYPRCAKAFSQKSHLLEHTKRHFGMKNEYPGCAKLLSQNSDLQDSIECNKTFLSKN